MRNFIRDLAENLEVPATRIQLQFSHTGLLCEGEGGGHGHTAEDTEVPVTSWMAVEVEIAPVQVDPGSTAHRTAVEVRRQHADIAACIVAALADPASSLRHSPSLRYMYTHVYFWICVCLRRWVHRCACARERERERVYVRPSPLLCCGICIHMYTRVFSHTGVWVDVDVVVGERHVCLSLV